MAQPGGALALGATRTTGAEVRGQNVAAVAAVANIVKSSLGPVGLDKVSGRGGGGRRSRASLRRWAPPRSHGRLLPSLPPQMLVDDIGDVTITNDGATILKLLDVEHPAAKVRREGERRRGERVRWGKAPPLTDPHSHTLHTLPSLSPQILVDLAQLQDAEVGDGTTSVVVMAAELLKRGADLVRSGVHPTSVIAGYRLAAKEGVRFINESLAIPVATLGEGVLVNVAATTMASKVVGGADGAAFARIVVDALLAVRRGGVGGGPPTYPVKGVTILKAAGGAMGDSRLVRGVALAASRCAQGMPTRVSPARIACLDMNLQKARMHMGVSVVVTDPKELEAIRERESTIARDRVRALLDAGATVVLTTKGIDDLCTKYFVEAGALAARRVPKDDLKRVARATGATIVSTLADDAGGETFDPAWLGVADEVVEENVAGDDVLVIRSGVVANDGAAAAAVAASPSAANDAKAAAPASSSPPSTTPPPPPLRRCHHHPARRQRLPAGRDGEGGARRAVCGAARARVRDRRPGRRRRRGRPLRPPRVVRHLPRLPRAAGHRGSR